MAGLGNVPRTGDNSQISSSTSFGDSIPPTPVDIHGENDLSVPSPNPTSGLLPTASSRLATAGVRNDDDMVDSTVDSSGIPLERGNIRDANEVINKCCNFRVSRV